jgi:protein-L-isoaspartate(D-aspartate) O-methyltransferase
MTGDPYGLRRRDIIDPRVLAAMAAVPRVEFVPEAHRLDATADHPLPIGEGQTISQPYIVAWMTQELAIAPGQRVLEIGTGSGYQAAILAEVGAEVYSIEVSPALAHRARETLARLGYQDLHLRTGSGYDGWPEEVPFDRILLTAAPPAIPEVLTDALADGGRLLAPVGTEWQVMVTIDRKGDRLTRRSSLPVRFVPMR